MKALTVKFFRPALNLSLWFVWLLVIVCTWMLLLNYEMSPADASKNPQVWPKQSAIGRDSSRPNLIMFVHPKCPCSFASLTELAKIMDSRHNLRATVVFVKPANVKNHWEQTELFKRASSNPNLSVFVDEQSIEAHNFDAHTSGETLLYDGSGHLVYSGGITMARGHEGSNLGEDTLVNLLDENNLAHSGSAPVYGCQLADDPSPNKGILRKCLR